MKKKKIFRRVIAAFLAVLSLMSIGIQAAAAFVAAGAIEGIVAMCVTIAVACGLMSQSEAETKAVRLPMDLTSEVYLYLLEEAADPLTPYKTSIAAIKAAGKIKEVTDGVNGFLNEHYGKTKTKEDKNYSGVSFASDFSDFIQSAQSHVKQVADSSVDLNGNGFGAYAYDVNTGALRTLYLGQYIEVKKGALSGGVVVGNDNVNFKMYGVTLWQVPKSYDPSQYDVNVKYDPAINTSNSFAGYRLVLYGDVRYTDGTAADDITTAVDTKPASIGDVKDAEGNALTDAEGNPYVVNADGTVTVDGQDIPINDDGTVTINGDTYNVTYNLSNYDDTAIIDLLQRILAKINQAQIIDETPADDVSSIPIPAVDADFADFQLSPSVATVFPFCIPWDLVRGIKLLAADPVAPRFEIPFNVPSFGEVFPGYEGTVVIDFAEYDKYFKVVRWGTFMIAMFGICFLTFKIVKGNT